MRKRIGKSASPFNERGDVVLNKEVSDKQYKLFVENSVTKVTDVVKNDMPDYYIDDLKMAKIAIDNIIKYKNRNVYKFLPNQVADIVEKYNFIIKDMIDNATTSGKHKEVVVVPSTYKQCSKCRKYLPDSEFKKTSSDFTDGTISICTECMTTMFNMYLSKYDDIREVLILMCHKIDVCVHESVLTKYVDKFITPEGQTMMSNGTFFTMFINEAALMTYTHATKESGGSKGAMFENTNFGGIPFKSCETDYTGLPVYDDKIVTNKEKDAPRESLSTKECKRLISKFGEYEIPDLIWLDDRYAEWESNYDIEALNSQKLIVQMCCDELAIRVGRVKGIDIDKLQKSFLASMKALELTPKQTKKGGTGEGFSSLGEFIQHVETERPFVDEENKYEDVSGFRKIIRGLAGSIATTLGKANKYSEMFDEDYAEYTSDVFEYMSDDDIEEEPHVDDEVIDDGYDEED